MRTNLYSKITRLEVGDYNCLWSLFRFCTCLCNFFLFQFSRFCV